MNNLQLFAKLTKVDEMKQEVTGVLAEEAPDKSGEIFDYESSKPLFQAWNAEFEKATGGKSLGNVREMHEPSAVGKFTAVDYADDTKQIVVTAKVVDKDAWDKVVEGVYTGFSIGGQYEKTWRDGEYMRYTAKPAEGSLVDNPCMYGAHFTAIKADGSQEVRKFEKKKKTKTVDGEKLGAEDFAYVGDPEETSTWKLPIHDEDHIRNAMARFNQTKGIPEDEKKKVARRIVAAARKHGIDADHFESEYAKMTKLNKSLYSVGRLAELLDCISYLQAGAVYERDMEGDDSPIPEKLKEWLKTGGEILTAMTAEEVNEMLEALKAAGAESLKKAQTLPVAIVKAADLRKAGIVAAGKLPEDVDAIYVWCDGTAKAVIEKKGARHSKETREHMDGIKKCAEGVLEHIEEMYKDDGDVSMAAGAANLTKGERTMSTNQTAAAPDLSKFAQVEAVEKLTKTLGEQSELIKSQGEQISTLSKSVEGLTAILEKVLAEPEQPKVAAKGVAVSKEQDNGGGAGAAKSSDPKDLIKQSHQNPTMVPAGLRI